MSGISAFLYDTSRDLGSRVSVSVSSVRPATSSSTVGGGLAAAVDRDEVGWDERRLEGRLVVLLLRRCLLAAWKLPRGSADASSPLAALALALASDGAADSAASVGVAGAAAGVVEQEDVGGSLQVVAEAAALTALAGAASPTAAVAMAATVGGRSCSPSASAAGPPLP